VLFSPVIYEAPFCFCCYCINTTVDGIAGVISPAIYEAPLYFCGINSTINAIAGEIIPARAE